MLLQDAIAQLQQGHAVCREGWTIEDGYLQLMKGMDYIWKIVLKPTPNAGNYIFALADLMADDWKLFDLPKDVVDAQIEEVA